MKIKSSAYPAEIHGGDKLQSMELNQWTRKLKTEINRGSFKNVATATKFTKITKNSKSKKNMKSLGWRNCLYQRLDLTSTRRRSISHIRGYRQCTHANLAKQKLSPWNKAPVDASYRPTHTITGKLQLSQNFVLRNKNSWKKANKR